MSVDLSSPSPAYRKMKFAAVTLMAVLLGTLFYYSNLHEQLFQRKEREQIRGAGPVDARPLSMDFEFIDDATRAKHRLSSLRGKVVHINFWASWCQPCQDELPFLANIQKEYGDQLEILLVNLDSSEDSVAAAREMQAHLAPQLTAIYENTASLRVLFNVEVLPFHYIIDKKGRAASAFYSRVDKDEENFKELLLQLLNEAP